jgi:hypothetical protein
LSPKSLSEITILKNAFPHPQNKNNTKKSPKMKKNTTEEKFKGILVSFGANF